MLSELRAISSGPLPALRHRGLAQDRARGEAPASSIPTSPPMSCPVAAGLEGDRARSPQGLAPPPGSSRDRALPRPRAPARPRARPPSGGPAAVAPVHRPRPSPPRGRTPALGAERGRGLGEVVGFWALRTPRSRGGERGSGGPPGQGRPGQRPGRRLGRRCRERRGGGVAGARGGQGAYVGFIRAVGYPYFCRAAPVSASGGRRGEWRRGRPRRGGRSGPATTRARGRGCWRCP